MSKIWQIGKLRIGPKQLAACKADFRNFLRVCWEHLGLPEPTPMQYELAHYLQYGPKRQIICGFRGVGKSWITSAFVIWKLWRNPDDKILVVSASKQRADDFSTFTLKLIKEVPFVAHLKPGRDQRESKIAFDVGPAKAAHASSVRSSGITGMITGSRANHIIADDVEVPNNSATEDMREKLMHAVSEFEAILTPEGDPRITFLGTPQTEESIYNKLADKTDTFGEAVYEMRVYPSRFPSYDDIGKKYKYRIAPHIIAQLEGNQTLTGRPTDPQRFTDMDLLEREAAYGKSGFALQFMLDTTLSDAEKYPLKTSDLIVLDCAEDKAPISVVYGSGKAQMVQELANVGFTGDRWFAPMYIDTDPWKAWEGVIMAIDPSGRGRDETAYCVMAQHHGKLYILESKGLKGGYETYTLLKIAQAAKRFNVGRILIEANFGDGMFTQILKPVLKRVYPCTCEDVKHSIQKEKRIIDTLEPIMNQHRLVVARSVVEDDIKQVKEDRDYALFYQLTRITKERGALKQDDRLDSVAMAAAHWLKQMGRDEKSAKAEHRKRELDKELKVFMKHVDTGIRRSRFSRPMTMVKSNGILGGRKRLI